MLSTDLRNRGRDRQSGRTTLVLSLLFGMGVVGSVADWCSAAMILGDPVPLSNLVNNAQAEIVVGDKRFTDFTYVKTGDMPGAGGVNIIPIKDDLGNFGIRVQGFFVDMASTDGGSDALITYNVESTDPLRLISDAHLQGNPVLPDGRGLIGVTETFLPLGAQGEYTMTIYDDEQKPVPKLVDWVYFVPPVRSLSVQKDIGAFAFAGFAAPTMSFVDQTFSQIVPEPITLVSLISGAIAIGLRRPGDRLSRRPK
jgi:hypothetical protein